MTGSFSYKDQGNEQFREGNWLKAAALYSKGLKEDPKSAVLLRLNKVQKALADAEECIQVKPDWDKGHFRKGSVLEAINKYDRALEEYQEALKCNPESREVASKIKALSRLIRSPVNQNGALKDGTNGSVTSMQQYETIKANVANGQEISKTTERIDNFYHQMLSLVETEIHNKTYDRTFPSVFFLPGRLNDSGKEQAGQVSIQSAFDSPDTLTNATSFLRQYAQDTAAQAAVTIAPKHKIAFPQVWQKAGWPHGRADGIFVQLQVQGSSGKLVFLPLKQRTREYPVLKEKFMIMESLLK